MKRLPPLSPDLDALLEAHRVVVPLPPSLRSRVLARAAATATASDPAPVHVARIGRWAFAAAAGGVIALGAAAYAAHGWMMSPDRPARAPLGPAAAPQPGRPHAPMIPAAEPETLAPSKITAPRGGPPARAAAASNAELTLLLIARRAVSINDFAGALAVTSEHARRFRNGRLIEEREALRVRSLAGLGRHRDARRAAAEFHARFPHSVLLSTFGRIAEPGR